MAFRIVLLSLIPLAMGGGVWDAMMAMENMEKEKKDSGEDMFDMKDFKGWGKDDSSSFKGWGEDDSSSFKGWGKDDSSSFEGWGKKEDEWSGWGSMGGWEKSGKFQVQKEMMDWMMKQMQEKMESKKEEKEDGWMQEHNKEHMAAYQKWCAEKKERQMMMRSKQQFMEWMQQESEKRDMMEAQARAEMESKVRQKKIKMQYEQWKTMFSQQKGLESMLHKFKYMKTDYMSTMMCELLKFCKCNDVNMQLKKYYLAGGNSTIVMPETDDTMFDLEDIKDALDGDTFDVARKVFTMGDEERMKLFFGTAVSSLCEGAKNFAMKVSNWEKTFD